MRSLLVVTAFVCAFFTVCAFEVEQGNVDPKLIVLSFFLYGLLINVLGWIAFHGRRIWKELLLSVASLFAILIVCEYTLRWAIPSKVLPLFRHCRSSRYHHVSSPSRLMYRGVYDGKHVFIKTNEDGLRSEYSRKEFLSHRTRIFVLGDSFTFGFGVQQDKAFTQVLENELRRQQPDADLAVLNAGSISYSPFLEARRLVDLGPLYKPQHVLLFLDPGDIGDDLLYAALTAESQAGDGLFYKEDSDPEPYYGAIWQLATPYHAVFTEPFRLGRTLIDPTREKAPLESLNRQIEVELEGKLDRNRFFIYRYPLEKTRPYFDATAQHLEKIAQTARAIGADFTLFVLPRYHHWNPKESPHNWERSKYALDEPFQFEYFRYFRELRAKVNYRIVDLLGDFQQTDEFPLVFDEDPHWTERGHAFVGRTVSHYVNKEFASAGKTIH